MKRAVFNYLVIATLTVSVAVTSCKKDDVSTVEFITNGGTNVSSITVKNGELIDKPDDPEREGYTFDGWYSDSNFSTVWNFTTDKVTNNVKLYANWFDDSVVKLLTTITYNIGHYKEFEYDNLNRITKELNYRGGKIYSTETLDYNSTGDLVKWSINYFDEPENNEERDYTKNGNKIQIGDNDILTVNNYGYPSVRVFKDEKNNTSSNVYYYEKGNIEFIEIYSRAYELDDPSNVGRLENTTKVYFEYDNKRSPFYHCKTSIFYLILDFDFVVNNNVLKMSGGKYNREYKYVYDSDGYPTKITRTSYEEDGDWTDTRELKYKLLP